MENKDENKINTLGWDAITNEAERVYPEQKDPKHYGTIHPWRFGGPDPLDGISIYDGGDYYHFVSYGLSELYEKVSDDKEWSGWGMEFTFKLKKANYENTEDEIICICNILQTIARITFNNSELFLPYQFIYSGQTEGIDSKQKSNITGFITVPDTDFNTINTPYGKVEFVELIGATDAELLKLKNKEMSVKELYEKLGTDITDYNRKSVI